MWQIWGCTAINKKNISRFLRNFWITFFILCRPAGDKGINFSNYQPFSLKNLRKFNDSARIPTIFTQHAIFSKDIDKIYPKKETFSFTILRSTSFSVFFGKKVSFHSIFSDPVTQFQSIFNYVHQVNDDFRKFSNVEEYLESRLNGSRISKTRFSARFSRNSVFKSFGYSTKSNNLENILTNIDDRKGFDIWRLFEFPWIFHIFI